MSAARRDERTAVTTGSNGIPPAGTAARAWACILTLVQDSASVNRFLAAASAVGLTAASLKALLQLDPEHPVPMRALADELHCDASNVTQLVDALETPGYVERATMPTDRRVKLLRVTGPGVQARQRAIATLCEPPPALAALSVSEQADLARLLTKILAACEPPLRPLA